MDIGSDEQAPADLTFVAFDPNNPTASHRAPAPSAKSKQRSITEEDKANMRAVRAKGPCMRCKLLKKQCDEGEPCRQCPTRNTNSARDHWKALGCLRDLTSLAELDVLDRLDQEEHLVKFFDGSFGFRQWQYLDPIVTAATERKTEVKINRLYRVFQDLKSDDYTVLDPRGCYDSNVSYAVFSVLGGLSINFSYDNIVRLAEEFLIASFVSCMSEGDCQRLQSSGSTQGFFPTYHTNEVRSSTLRQHLQSYLSVFQERCSRRGQITPQAWAATFYSLCILNESLITLERAVSASRAYLATRSRNFHNQLRAIYVSLVKTFCWTQGQSDLLGEASSVDQDRISPIVLYEIKTMSGHDKWESSGIKSTKMFLEILGRPYESACEKIRLFFIRKGLYCADPKWFNLEVLWASPLGLNPATATSNLERQFYLSCREAAISPRLTTAGSSTIPSTFAESVAEEGLLESKVEEEQVYERQVHETLSVLDSLMEGRVSVGECEERISELQMKQNPLSGWGIKVTQLWEALPMDRLPMDRTSHHSLSIFSFKTPSSHTSSLRQLRKIPLESYGCCGISLATMQDLIDHYEQCHSKPADCGDQIVEELLVDEQPEDVDEQHEEMRDIWFENSPRKFE